MEAGHQQNALQVRQELNLWYRRATREHPDRPVYRLAAFTLKTLGPRDSPLLKGPKAAETGTLLRFAAEMVRKHMDKLPNGPALLACGEALVAYLDITRTAGPRLNPPQLQALVTAVLRFLGLRAAAGLPYTPKMHLMLHLVHQSKRFGNPLHVATWADESLNCDFAKVCAAANSSVWDKRVMATMNSSTGPLAKATRTD
eukprot:2366746-Lingulodinium_polyedra.AAC.2